MYLFFSFRFPGTLIKDTLEQVPQSGNVYKYKSLRQAWGREIGQLEATLGFPAEEVETAV